MCPRGGTHTNLYKQGFPLQMSPHESIGIINFAKTKSHALEPPKHFPNPLKTFKKLPLNLLIPKIITHNHHGWSNTTMGNQVSIWPQWHRRVPEVIKRRYSRVVPSTRRHTNHQKSIHRWTPPRTTLVNYPTTTSRQGIQSTHSVEWRTKPNCYYIEAGI